MAFLTIVATAALLLAFMPRWTVDDAYITFRYARNLAIHGALTWNVGEDPVQGFTGVLWPLFLALPARLGLSLPIFTQATGAAFLAGSGVALVAVGRELKLSTLTILVVVLLFLLNPVGFTHAYSGLETVPFAVSLLVAFWAVLKGINGLNREGERGRAALLMVACLSAALLRPEGFVMAVMFLSAYFAAVVGGGQGLRGSAVLFLCLFLVPFLAYEAWAWLYYGDPLPNTFYAKTRHLSLLLSSRSLPASLLATMGEFLLAFLVAPSLASMAVLMMRSRPITAPPAPRALAVDLSPALRSQTTPVLAFLTFGLALIFGYYSALGQLSMNYSFRFLYPYFPLLLLLIAAVADPLPGIPARRWSRSPWRLGLAAVALVLMLAQLSYYETRRSTERAFAAEYQSRLTTSHIPLGVWLHERVPPGEWLVVHVDAGAIPYYADLKTVDFGRLNDKFLARKPPVREAVDYFFSKRPGVLVFTSYQWACLDHGAEAAMIASDSRFEQYRLVRRFRSIPDRAYYEFAYLRADLLEGLEGEIGEEEQTSGGSCTPTVLPRA